MTAPPKVLVVIDSLLVRLTLREILEKEGYAVLSASNGREALALLETSDVDLILSELEMPEMDGRALLLALRAHLRHAWLPVVLILTYPWDALTIQADAFLVKPFFQTADMLAKLKELIGPRCA